MLLALPDMTEAERGHAVPNVVLSKLLGKLEIPTASDAHEVVYVIG